MSFVPVAETDGEEPIEIPTEQDQTILITTLSAQFPHATGLKYRTESGGFRGLRIAEGKVFPPENGWEKLTYIVVTPKVDPSDNKRKGDVSIGDPTAKTKRFERKCSDLIVLGLPWSKTEDDLKEYFEQYGNLLMAQVKRDDKGHSKGFGFIRFAEISAQDVVLNKRHKIGDRWCDVKVPNSKVETSYSLQQNRKVFVGRCTEDMTADDLKEYFSNFGEVLDVFIPKPFRAFAFVTFQDPEVASRLCGEDHIINRVSVHVSGAVPREPGKSRGVMGGRMEPHMPGGAWGYGGGPIPKPAPPAGGWGASGPAAAGNGSLTSNMAGLNLGGFQVNPHALLAAALQQNAMNILGQAMNPTPGGSVPAAQSQAHRDLQSQGYGSPATQTEEGSRNYTAPYQGWSGAESGGSWSGKQNNWN